MGFYPENSDSENETYQIGEDIWGYSDDMFNDNRKDMEKLTTWRYSGGIDLILTQVVKDPNSEKNGPDFSNSIVCYIDDLIDIKAFSKIDNFFEKLFRYADQSSVDNPIWELSDQFGLATIKSSIKRFVLSLLPNKLLNELDLISQFAVVDLKSMND